MSIYSTNPLCFKCFISPSTKEIHHSENCKLHDHLKQHFIDFYKIKRSTYIPEANDRHYSKLDVAEFNDMSTPHTTNWDWSYLKYSWSGFKNGYDYAMKIKES